MRRVDLDAGRSINLALAARGIQALELAGVIEQVQPLVIPMPGRMLHDLNGALILVPYGRRPTEVIYSVSGQGFNCLLLDAAERAGVEVVFSTLRPSVPTSIGNVVIFRNDVTQQVHEADMQRVLRH